MKLNKSYSLISNIALSILLTIFCLVPYIIIIIFGLDIPIIPPGTIKVLQTHKHFLGHFIELLKDKIFILAYLNSVKLALISTIICVVITYPTSYYIARQSEQKKSFLISLILIPFFSSILIRIYSWIILLRNTGVLNNALMDLHIIAEPLRLINTEISVIIGMVYIYLPFMIIPIVSAIERIPYNLIEASQDLGANSSTTFFKVILPLSLKGVISGVLLVFIPAMGEYIIPELLGGAEILTIGKLIWVQFFVVRDISTACGVALSLTIFLILPVYFVNRLGKAKN